MRFGDSPESENFEDRTGQSGGGGLSLGGAGGGVIALLAQFVLSRFGFVGLLILLLGYCALTSLGGGGGILGGGSTQEGPSKLDPATGKFMRQVLGSTEQVWNQVFQQAGATYQPTRLVAYTDYNQSGCGAAQAAMGPFYCPTDKQIYIDPAFFNELSRRFGAPGDFAQAYVIAHEVGHHVQNLLGILPKVARMRQSLPEAQANALSVRVELQADCFAGIWGRDASDKGLLEPGDLDEALNAAAQIGDDAIQRRTQGIVVPESFNHGTSQQRARWFKRGFDGQSVQACDTFSADSL
jgi:predicted metalloprotease